MYQISSQKRIASLAIPRACLVKKMNQSLFGLQQATANREKKVILRKSNSIGVHSEFELLVRPNKHSPDFRLLAVQKPFYDDNQVVISKKKAPSMMELFK